jgi:hypothetical protein
MATYNAGDFIGKTIFITDRVPVYSRGVRVGEQKPAPVRYLQRGDNFIVSDLINQAGAYSKYIDHYWLIDTGGAVAFKDIAGKYDTKALLDQGLKSDEDKGKTTTKAGELLKKYLPYVLGTILLATVVPAYLRRNK